MEAAIYPSTKLVNGLTADLLEPVHEDVNENVMTLGLTTKIMEGECNNLEGIKIIETFVMGLLERLSMGYFEFLIRLSDSQW